LLEIVPNRVADIAASATNFFDSLNSSSRGKFVYLQIPNKVIADHSTTQSHAANSGVQVVKVQIQAIKTISA
jgi:hypothetical protein